MEAPNLKDVYDVFCCSCRSFEGAMGAFEADEVLIGNAWAYMFSENEFEPTPPPPPIPVPLPP